MPTEPSQINTAHFESVYRQVNVRAIASLVAAAYPGRAEAVRQLKSIVSNLNLAEAVALIDEATTA